MKVGAEDREDTSHKKAKHKVMLELIGGGTEKLHSVEGQRCS